MYLTKFGILKSSFSQLKPYNYLAKTIHLIYTYYKNEHHDSLQIIFEERFDGRLSNIAVELTNLTNMADFFPPYQYSFKACSNIILPIYNNNHNKVIMLFYWRYSFCSNDVLTNICTNLLACPFFFIAFTTGVLTVTESEGQHRAFQMHKRKIGPTDVYFQGKYINRFTV